MKILQIIQLVIAVSLMAVILLQNRGSGLAGIFGGSGGVFRTKRGIEKTLFTATIILSILFLAVSLFIFIY
ncbi:preprotein translocase subunit SecG [Candidatus Parcubacteria bacterium]|nr:preprotein translocase subunit SecG [Candidatus Parcubacteria bacterium]